MSTVNVSAPCIGRQVGRQPIPAPLLMLASTGGAGIHRAGAKPPIQTFQTPLRPSKMPPSTPCNSPKRQEHDTTRRARFFEAWDSKKNGAGVGTVCQKLDFHLPPSTARDWIRQRDIQGSKALRRTRKQ